MRTHSERDHRAYSPDPEQWSPQTRRRVLQLVAQIPASRHPHELDRVLLTTYFNLTNTEYFVGLTEQYRDDTVLLFSTTSELFYELGLVLERDAKQKGGNDE